MSMKFFLAAALLAFAGNSLSQTFDFTDPQHRNQLDYRISGYSESTHYITPVQVTFKNNSLVSKQIKIANGQLLVPDDDAYQGFVVTKELLAVLQPKQEKTFLLHAMCTNADLPPPDGNITYSPGPESKKELTELTSLIERSGAYNIEAQSAVWSYFGDRTLDQIVGFDTLLVEELTTMLAESLNLEMPAAPEPEDYSRSYYVSESSFKYTIKGRFRYQLFEKSAVLIAMFDANNIVVRELYRNNTCAPGHHNIDYNFDATHFDNPFYYVRLLENGKIMLEIEVKTPEELRQG